MNKLLDQFFLYFILICSVLVYILSFTNINDQIHPLLPLFIAIIFLILSFKIFGYFILVLFFPFILGFIGNFIGNIFTENGMYMIELQRYSYFTGSTNRLLAPGIIFLLTVFFFGKLLIKNLSMMILYRRKTYDYIFIFIGSFFLLILYSGFLFKGIPLLEGISRVQYRTDHPIPVVKFEVYFRLLLLGLGIIYVSALHYKKNSIKRYTLMLLFLFTLYMFLQGSKFTGIWSAFYLFYLPYVFYLYKNNRKVSFKYLFIISSLMILLISYIVTYYNMRGYDGFTVFKSRLAMQGEVWWSIDNQLMENNLDGGGIEQLKNELEYIVFREDETKVGLKHLMYLIAPSSLVDKYLAKNVTFTSGYPAIALLIFGYFGLLLFQLLAGLITVLIVWVLLVSISKGYVIESIVLTKIYWTTTSAFGMGYFYKLFDLKILVYLFVVFVIFNLRYFFNKNKRVKSC